MNWAYGITTVPERQYNYFPKTLQSLKDAGFDKPMIFVDGNADISQHTGDLQVVYRSSRIQAFGNWMLALLELWIRFPQAERYAIFQDDLLAYKNLFTYLDKAVMPPDTYWNLYTFPQNEDLCGGKRGWFYSNQRGRGAVALVFSAPVVFRLLTDGKFVDKPRAKRNAHRSIDGTVCNTLIPLGIKEMIHYPTLTQHQGDCSSIGNPQHDKPKSWLGEQYDAIELLQPAI